MLSRNYHHYYSLIATSILLSACAVGPEYVRPSVEVSPQFKEMPSPCATGQANCADIVWKLASPQDSVTRSQWWTAYEDPQLDQLMDRFEQANQNIIALEAQYRQAQALVEQSQASFFPTLSANASATKSKSSSARSTSTQSEGQTYTLQAQAAWEPDLWGKLRRAEQASTASAQASAANVEAAKLSARAALARAYFQLRILDLQKTSAAKTVQLYARALEITKHRYENGMAARAEIAAMEVQYGNAQVALFDLDIQRTQSEHAIAVLVGEDPSRFHIDALPTWQATLPAIPALLPSQLLERRPDIASAERNVAAASAKIGVAKAAYFPSLNFSAALGYQSSSLAHLLSLPNQIWSFGPALAAALFDGGLRRAQVSQAQAVYDQTVAQYRQVVLNSIQEVEDNLIALHILDKEVNTQTNISEAARQTAEFAMKRYRAGNTDFLSTIPMLSAEEANERSVLTLLGRRYLAHITLMAALGGGQK